MFYIIIGIVLPSLLSFGGSFFSFEGLFDLHGIQFQKISLGKIAILLKIIPIRETSLVIFGLNILFFYKLKKDLVVQFNGDADKNF